MSPAGGRASVDRDWGAAIGGRLDQAPLAVLLDVDGTLAPIAPTPDSARVPVETREVVERLARLPGVTVALVSGRAAADAYALVGVTGIWTIGNHGLEVRRPDGAITPDAAVERFEDRVSEAAGLLSAELGGITGVIVEDKRWTLSVHYRIASPGDVPRVSRIAAEVAARTGLRAMAGKKIIELRPPVEVHKGTACVAFVRSTRAGSDAGAVLYAGDDRTDEDAFRELRAAFPSTVTIRIASTDDLPDQTSGAELVLDTPDQLRDVLVWLATRRASATR
jgi:trehalose-phosphatase